MKLSHFGNREVIESNRCCVDAQKYSRVTEKDIKPDKEKQLEVIPKDAFLKMSKMKIVELNSDKNLYISHNPHSWFLIEKKFSHNINRLQEGQKYNSDMDQKSMQLLYNKGLLAVNGIQKKIEPLSGRYITRSDNVALISITDRCNLNCEHCVAGANSNQLGREMTIREIEGIFKSLQNQKDPFRLDVEKKVFLSGGEPSVRSDFYEIIRKCSENSLSTNICTNGLLLDEDELKALKQLPLSFLISLDGKINNHEIIRGNKTFDKTIKKILFIKKLGYDVFLNTFVHQDNFEDVEYLAKFTVENNINGINFIRAIPRGRGKKMEFKRVPDAQLFSKLYGLMKSDPNMHRVIENENTFSLLTSSILAGVKSKNCGYVRENYFFLDSGGSVYPCPGMRYDEFKLGSIKEKTISEILNNDCKMQLSGEDVDNFGVCSNCDYKYFCGGDCRGSAYGNSTEKSLNDPVPYCEERKESIKTIFEIIDRDHNFLSEKVKRFEKNAKEETILKQEGNQSY
jgi:radical SAM protein with 4Fe4S-binding SPASM domain